MISNVSTPLLGAVDTAVMGHLPDPAYIGGVAIGAVLFNFLFWGFGFLRMGTTGFTAQAQGAGDHDELRAALVRPLILAVGLGGLVIAVQVPVGLFAFAILDASSAVEALAGDYFAVRIWSAPFALANYALLGWLLGVQRPVAVVALQIGLNGTNIVLDLLFVVGFGWGIEGVALASLIAEAGAAGFGLWLVRGQLTGPIDRARVFARARRRVLFRVNLDILIRTLCLIAAFAYMTALSAEMGDTVLAANAVLLQFVSFMAYGLDGFAHAVEVLAGHALGARLRGAFRQAVVVSTLWALGAAVLATLVLWLGGGPAIALFTNIADVRDTAAAYMPWIVAAPLVSIWSFQLDGIFIGATRTAEMRNAMIASLGIFLAACWLLVPALGNHGLWLAFTVFMAVRGVSLAVFYPRLERTVGAGAESSQR
jgi:MATE family multidrug resistance protein